MKKISYIVTRNGTGELVSNALLDSIAKGAHGAHVIAIFFAEDGVYHLMKGSRSANRIKAIIKTQDVRIMAFEESVKNRNLQNVLIDGVEIGQFSDFYKLSDQADHIISF